MTDSKVKDTKDSAACVGGLQALDDQIRATTGGEPGAGLYDLLSLLAGQFLGVPRSAMPTQAPPQTLQENDPRVRDPSHDPRFPTSHLDRSGGGEDMPLPTVESRPTKAMLAEMTKDELLTLADEEGAEIHQSWNKGDIVDAIVRHRRQHA